MTSTGRRTGWRRWRAEPAERGPAAAASDKMVEARDSESWEFWDWFLDCDGYDHYDDRPWWEGLCVAGYAAMVDGVVHRFHDGLSDCGEAFDNGYTFVNFTSSDELLQWNREHDGEESHVTCLECLVHPLRRW